MLLGFGRRGSSIGDRRAARGAINDTGITITNGQATIQIAGPSVTVNNGALVVT